MLDYNNLNAITNVYSEVDLLPNSKESSLVVELTLLKKSLWPEPLIMIGMGNEIEVKRYFTYGIGLRFVIINGLRAVTEIGEKVGTSIDIESAHIKAGLAYNSKNGFYIRTTFDIDKYDFRDWPIIGISGGLGFMILVKR